jgi:EAL domain-containing protein (putative c-di-GMP-specific phosphodiesterase class I)
MMIDAQFQISVNISPVQFRSHCVSRSGWFDHLQKIGLPNQSVAGEITVEITEGMLLEASTAVKVTARIRTEIGEL